MPSLSPNGRYVAFCSTACNLVRPDRRPRVPHTGPGLDPHTDVFVCDLRRGVTRRASSDRRGRMANAGERFPQRRRQRRGSARIVSPGPLDCFTAPSSGTWQRDSGAVTALANAGSCARTADVSADGHTALFTADMPGLVPNDVRDARQSDAFVMQLR